MNPFARYYFNPKSANSHFFAQVSPRANISGSTVIGLDAGVGVTHFLAPGVGLDTYLSYVNTDLSSTGGGSVGLSTGLNILLDRESFANRRTAEPGVGRGSLMIGGTGGIARLAQTGQSNVTAVGISPNVLYFLNDRLALGAGLEMGFARNDSESFTYNVSTIGISPQARYYFARSPRQHWFMALGGDAAFTSITGNVFEGKSKSYGFDIGAGMNAFLNRNVALEIGPYLQYRTQTFDGNSSSGLRLGLNVGLQFILNKGGK